MTPTQKAAMEQALDALRNSKPNPSLNDDEYGEKAWYEHFSAITALRTALAEQPAEQEPTWTPEECDRVVKSLRFIEGIAQRGEGRLMRDDETLEQFVLGYVKKLEQPAEQVAWNWMQGGNPCGPVYYGNPPDADIEEVAAKKGKTVRRLYTAPQPVKQPLTTQEIDAIFTQVASTQEVYDMAAIRQSIARAIERAHGITGETK